MSQKLKRLTNNQFRVNFGLDLLQIQNISQCKLSLMLDPSLAPCDCKLNQISLKRQDKKWYKN